MKRIPLTILAYGGPMLTAYVAALKHAGIGPERVVTIAPKRLPDGGRAGAAWLPKSIRGRYVALAGERQQNHWPRKLKTLFPATVASLRERLSDPFPFFDGFYGMLESAPSFAGWASRSETLLVEDYGDPVLVEALKDAGDILFTGGGLLPKSLVACPGTRFLHVHPGVLPHIRGADGLLWSALLRRKVGRSFFVMTPELDRGPLIRSEENEIERFEILEQDAPDDQMLYRMLYSYYDPCLRADLAARLICEGLPDSINTEPPEIGLEFPFMSNALRSKALKMFFARSKQC